MLLLARMELEGAPAVALGRGRRLVHLKQMLMMLVAD